MNAWAFAALQNLALLAVCAIVIWFHHEWYWVLSCGIGYGLLGIEVKSK